jgi:hypothetical protein
MIVALIVAMISVNGLIIQTVIALVCAKSANMTQMIMEKKKKFFVIVIKLKENVFGVINL